METGFLNPIHDEEHFTSSFYTQENELDDNDHMLFGEMIVPEVIDYDHLWHAVDDLGGPSHSGEPGPRKEDFQKMLFEWQNQLTYMEEPVIKNIIPVAEKASQEVSEMFDHVATSRTSNSGSLATPSLDELFPPESSKNIAEETLENNRVDALSNVPLKMELQETKWNITLETKPTDIETVFVTRGEGESPFLVDIETVDGGSQQSKLEYDVEQGNLETVRIERDPGKQSLLVDRETLDDDTQQSSFEKDMIKKDLSKLLFFVDNETLNDCKQQSSVEFDAAPSGLETVMIERDLGKPSFIVKNEADMQNTSVEAVKIGVHQRSVETVKGKGEVGEAPFLVDIETVNDEDEVPLLIAKDLTSLLEQFEATEKVNLLQPTPTSPPRPTSQTIRDALPAEVINRIKATRENHKKTISVIPAMPNKRSGKPATRMQDAGATLSRNKLLKLMTGGSGGESVQLDHDYCTSGDSGSSSSRSFYVSDSSEYPSQASTPDISFSRLPEFYTVATQRGRAADTGSRKDSGLESGENSEEEIQLVKNKVVLKTLAGHNSLNVVTENGIVLGSAPVMRNKVPMVSVLKKNIKVEKDSEVKPSAVNKVCSTPTMASTSVQSDLDNVESSKKKKKKLNLEEYRVRREEREKIRSQDSSRANSPVACSTPPSQPDSTTASQEGVPKEKPVMLSVEVQTQTCDFVDLTSSKPPKEQEKSQKDQKEKRSKVKHRGYRSRQSSFSSSCSSSPDRHRSHKRRRRSRSNRRHKNSVSRMWSRSPSHSSSRSHSVDSSRSRSPSRDRRQKWRSRSPRRSNSRYSNRSSFRSRERRDRVRDRSWQRARSPVRPVRTQEFGTQEKVRQVEERKIIYVGRISEGTTKADLRMRFQQFGPIIDISVHFRERGDNYGFVTFAYRADAYQALEHGNDDPKLPRYDLCFGGRRTFCKQRYADLDGIATSVHDEYGIAMPSRSPPRQNGSFDLLLHEMKAKIRKRSSV